MFAVLATLAVIIFGEFLTATAAQCAVIVVDKTPTNANWSISSDGVFVGLPGDYLSLDDGIRTLVLNGPQNFNLILEVEIHGSEVTLKSQKAEENAPCNGVSVQVWNVVKWDISRILKGNSGVIHIQITAPELQVAKNQAMSCAPLMMDCTKAYITLGVVSEPAGGEIWINGAQVGNKTNAVLSVPFCPLSEKSAHVLIRMPGRLNCAKDVELQPDVKETVSCELAPPP
jgi:hypothetical protein